MSPNPGTLISVNGLPIGTVESDIRVIFPNYRILRIIKLYCSKYYGKSALLIIKSDQVEHFIQEYDKIKIFDSMPPLQILELKDIKQLLPAIS